MISLTKKYISLHSSKELKHPPKGNNRSTISGGVRARADQRGPGRSIFRGRNERMQRASNDVASSVKVPSQVDHTTRRRRRILRAERDAASRREASRGASRVRRHLAGWLAGSGSSSSSRQCWHSGAGFLSFSQGRTRDKCRPTLAKFRGSTRSGARRATGDSRGSRANRGV